MKFVRALGGFLCFIGILAAMIGILATAVPMIDNEQVKRIVESFSLQSADQMLNTVNQVILYCLGHGSLLFGAGAITLLIGGLMKSGAERTLYRNEPVKQPAQRKAENREAARPAPTATARDASAPTPRTPIATPGYSPPRAARTAAMAQSTPDLFSAPPTEEKYRPRSIIDLTSEPEPIGNAEKETYSAYRDSTPKAANEIPSEKAEEAVYVAKYQVGPTSTRCAECGAENLLEQPVCSRCGQTLKVAHDLQPQAAYPQDQQRAVTRTAEATDSVDNRRSAYVASLATGNVVASSLQTQNAVMQTGEKLEKIKFHPPIPEKDPWMESTAGRSTQNVEQIHGTMATQAGSVKLSGSLLTQRNTQSAAYDPANANDARYIQPMTGTAPVEPAMGAEPVSSYRTAQPAGQATPSTDGKQDFRANEENAKPKSHVRIVSTMGKHSV